mgnify:CR=1 FL=1
MAPLTPEDIRGLEPGKLMEYVYSNGITIPPEISSSPNYIEDVRAFVLDSFEEEIDFYTQVRNGWSKSVLVNHLLF